MGVELQTYRSRIGSFIQPASRASRHDKTKYNPYCAWPDVHWRSFVTGLVLLSLACGIYGLMKGKYELETYFASPYPVEGYIIPCSKNIHPAGNPDLFETCASIYPAFHSRLLILASDVELNPGPSSDTDCILKAIEDSNRKTANDIHGLKEDIAGLKVDISGVQNELKSISAKVQAMEHRQTSLELEVQAIKDKCENIEYNAEIMQSDIGALSVNDERRCDQIDQVFKQLNAVDRELRKCNLRIFGVPDDEKETQSETKSKVINSVLNAASNMSNIADPPDPDSCLVFAKRLGPFNIERPRMILAKFRNQEDKFSLFKIRDNLRANGIKIANDLTTYEKQELDKLRQQGRRGYFNRGKLVVIDNDSNSSSNTRVFRRGARQLPPQRNSTDGVNGETAEME